MPLFRELTVNLPGCNFGAPFQQVDHLLVDLSGICLNHGIQFLASVEDVHQDVGLLPDSLLLLHTTGAG